jgi:hypothetical protein
LASYFDLLRDTFDSYRCDVKGLVIIFGEALAGMLFFGYALSMKRVGWAIAALVTIKGDLISDLWTPGDLQGPAEVVEKNKQGKQ